jgi:hypothetical protein
MFARVGVSASGITRIALRGRVYNGADTLSMGGSASLIVQHYRN